MPVSEVARTRIAVEVILTDLRGRLGEFVSDLLNNFRVLIIYLLWFSVLGVMIFWIQTAEARNFVKEVDRPFFKVIGWMLRAWLFGSLLTARMPLSSTEFDLVLGAVQIRA